MSLTETTYDGSLTMPVASQARMSSLNEMTPAQLPQYADVVSSQVLSHPSELQHVTDPSNHDRVSCHCSIVRQSRAPAMASQVSQDLRDPKTPDEVEIRLEARCPVTDPTLGIAVPPPVSKQARQRLVVLGDSLSHGFQSNAIFNTDLSYPAIIARELGWSGSFLHP